MKIKISYMDVGATDKVLEVDALATSDGFMTFSRIGAPLENGDPAFDFVYSVQAHLVKEITRLEEETPKASSEE